MKMFAMLDQLHNKYKKDDEMVEDNNKRKYVVKEIKCANIKEYKHQYYLDNIEIYRQRNKAYRERKKQEKKNII